MFRYLTIWQWVRGNHDNLPARLFLWADFLPQHVVPGTWAEDQA